MSRFGKFLLVATVFASLLAVGSGVLAGYALTHGRMVRLEMHQRSHAGSLDLDLPLPAGLVTAAIELAAIAPDSTAPRHDACPRRLHAWRPAMRAACRALAGAPDGTLLRVDSSRGRVLVIKRGDTVEVQVLGPEGEVRVTTPAGVVWHLADLV